MARQFSLAYLTIPGVDPVEQIKIARETGYDTVSLRTMPMGLPGEPRARLEQDAQLMTEVTQALKDNGMKLFDIELVQVKEDRPADMRAAFEKGAELGATQVLSSVWTKDHAFAVERYGTLCEQAAQFGLTVNMEFVTFAGVTDLKGALRLQDDVKADNLKIMVDTVHAHRSHVSPAEIAAVDPSRFGFIHLCDCPGPVPALDDPEMIRVAREGRLYIGEGGADIAGMLRALPNNPCSIELPNSQRIAELGAAGHARRCLESAKAYFAANGLG